MRNTLVASAFTMLSIATASAQLTIPKEYLPEVHGTIRNGNSYKFTPFLRIYAFGNVCNGFISIFLYHGFQKS